jgi:hypothetical protein
LRHCATSRKVAGSIPDGVNLIFIDNLIGNTMALGSTLPLTKMSTSVGLTTLPPSGADCLEIWEPHLPETLWDCFTFCCSQCPHGLRRRSAAARLLRLWVRITPGAGMFVCCECCVLSGRGLCDELITRPEESYRLW